ncbi:hypothetical protein HK405_004770, partial [Cladochytrium tenue]
LFDDTGERKDRFSTKPADPTRASAAGAALPGRPGGYAICALAFSPDATRLAVAQTDCAVFVYKLGVEWGEKKSICNKLIQAVEITCLTWPLEQNNALVFGLLDGKVRVGNLKTNKAATLYQTDSCVVSTASSKNGNAVITGHMDGSIYRFYFDDAMSGAAQGKFTTHSCPPTAIGWGDSIAAAGSDRRVVFYEHDGRVLQEFDYSRDEDEQEFTVLEMSPSGQCAIAGSFDRVRLNERKSDDDIKRIAYLVDLQTIHILDLNTGHTGDIEDIEREGGKTEVIVDEGVSTVSYTLDETLIEFGTALDDKDYERAVALLETLELTPETEAMWKSLSTLALKNQKILIAQRCFSALGDVARARYLGNIDGLQNDVEEEAVVSHYTVQARLAILEKQFKYAEGIYLEQGKPEEAMEMYQELHKWDQSIKVAEAKNHPDLEQLKKNYFQWLLDSNQEDRAGELKEDDGDYVAAINLFLKGGMPARAAQILNLHGLNHVDLTERVAAALFKAGLFEKAGNLYEKLGSNDRALDSYRKGKAFRAAVELSRLIFPHEVLTLEEKQMDAAINHYIEAGKSIKAAEAAISSKQWKKAIGIVDSLDPPEKGKPYFLELARHFAESGELQHAEKYFVKAGRPQEAVDMYTKANRWEKAHTLATTFMTSEEVALLYIGQAREMENEGKLKDAEKLYLTVGEPDLAINMYKSHKQYDQMIRLVAAHHKDLLQETHMYLAKILEMEGNLKQAETHYVEGKDWKAAINMYCANNSYDEAYRVAKTHGGPNSAKQVAYLWARSLGGESAVRLLTKFGLLDAAIDFATENGAFEFAFELTRFSDRSRLADVHYKHAMYLEDEGRFREAQDAFILAARPREAILMYIHNEDWVNALSVAESYEPASVAEVLTAQGRAAFERRDLPAAEALLMRAQKPDLAIKWYKEAGLWKEAVQFAKEYLPGKLAEVQDEYGRHLASKGAAGGRDELLASARALEQQRDFSRAIDMYLRFDAGQPGVDQRFLEEVWSRAVELATKFAPERDREVVTTVCGRLQGLRRFELAAEFYAAVEMFREAIDACAAAGLWDRAKEVVAVAPKYADYLEAAYVAHLKNQGQADALINIDVAAGLDLLVQKGEWAKCLDTAASNGPEVLNKYLSIHVVGLIKDSKFDLAAQQVAKHGVFHTSNNFDIYARLAREIIYDGSPAGFTALREVLFKLCGGPITSATGATSTTSAVAPAGTSNASGSPGSVPKELNRYMFITHLVTLRNYCAKKREMAYFSAKLSVSLLRYSGDIPPDRTFYEAGFYSKLAGMTGMAFVCWNRFLDI